MAHGKGDTKSRKYVKPGGKQTYAQNPYGPPGSYGENKKESQKSDADEPKMERNVCLADSASQGVHGLDLQLL